MLEIIFGVSQRSILGPLLLNTFLLDLFFIIVDTDIASYVNDNSSCVSADNIDRAIKSLEGASEILFKWFSENVMKLMLPNVVS